MRSTIQKWGNSQAVRLPKAVLKSASMGENDAVQIIAEKDQIIIKKACNRMHISLKERLKSGQEAYQCEELDSGVSIGEEVF